MKYRPDYPIELINVLKEKCGLSAAKVIADIGSGTGKLTSLLISHCFTIYAVEPNYEMSHAAEQTLGHDHRFVSINASAEETTLNSHSIDIITVAQSFHWFDRLRTKTEFRRILKKNGWVVLIWNERDINDSQFQIDYDAMLKSFIPEYSLVDHKNIDPSVISEFFHPNTWELITLKNFQEFDYVGLKGRLLSSSYTPNVGHPAHRPLIDELEKLFARHAINGNVRFDYNTKIYIGHLLT